MGEEWLFLRYILKIKLRGFINGLNVGYEGKGGVISDFFWFE